MRARQATVVLVAFLVAWEIMNAVESGLDFDDAKIDISPRETAPSRIVTAGSPLVIAGRKYADFENAAHDPAIRWRQVRAVGSLGA